MNDDHVKKLNEGVAAWNVWRNENPDIVPDLSGANLSGARLSGIDLSYADLRGIDLSYADLSNADLRGAKFA